MNTNKNILSIITVVSSCVILNTAMAAATFTLDIGDGPNEGFNDPTAVTPVGGNTGTTLGEQRRIVFERAGEIWGEFINSDVDIIIDAAFDPQTCNGNSAVLGSAGSNFIFRNFPNRPFSNTWYHAALADSLRGSDNNPGVADINATFNSEIDNGCLNGTVGWYYGLDGNAPNNTTSLLPVVLHELGHGLGSSTFANGSTGAFLNGVPDSWSRFMTDLTGEASWFELSSNADRAASALNNGFLVWDSPNVNNALRQELNASANRLQLLINFPQSIKDNHVAGSATFGTAVPAQGLSGNVRLAIDDESVDPGDVNDACSPITNDLSGRIALVNRGTCSFVSKVATAQQAGAIGVLITNNENIGISNMSGTDPTVTIPSLFISKVVGDRIKSELNTGVNITMGFTTEAFQGENDGHLRLFAPITFQGGSSVSHWDTAATPSLLMEPNITPSLFDQIDLTFQMFQDIGWDMVIEDDIFENGFEDPNL